MFGIFDKLTGFFKDILLRGTKANLKSIFLNIDDKAGVIAADIEKMPMSRNGEVYNSIKNINGSVIVSTAGLIIAAILRIELVDMVMQKNSMRDTDTSGFFRYVIEMFIVVYLASHTFEFSMAVSDVAQDLVNEMAGVITTSATVSGNQIVVMINTLKKEGIGEPLVILVETGLIRIATQCISLIITSIVYGCVFEIYVYPSVSFISFITIGNKEWGQIETNYIKGFFALGLQGLFLMVYLGIYTVPIRTAQVADIHTSLLSMLGYALLLGLMIFRGKTVAKNIMNTHQEEQIIKKKSYTSLGLGVLLGGAYGVVKKEKRNKETRDLKKGINRFGRYHNESVIYQEGYNDRNEGKQRELEERTGYLEEETTSNHGHILEFSKEEVERD